MTPTGDTSTHQVEGPPYQVSWETLSLAELESALEIGTECGCNPRGSRRGHASGIATAMTAGDWQSGIPDIVCLCTHGGISNGRHRCLAAVEARQPLTGWVGRDVPVEVIRYADIGLKRTPADALAGRGVGSYRTALGAAVRLLMLYDTQRDVHWSLWNRTRFTAPKIGDLFDQRYSGVVDTVEAGRQIESGTNCCPSAAAAFAYLMRREGGAERLAETAYGLAGGTPDVRDILAQARTRLSREAKHRGRKADHNRAPYELGLLITAVMAKEAGKARFTFGENSPMPKLGFAEQLAAEAV
ncbi:hypothetical protein [Streptomyces violaceusniger]|nr:hypothetical protein [Streptomyces violaceusniger]